jgi:hypothetical protein
MSLLCEDFPCKTQTSPIIAQSCTIIAELALSKILIMTANTAASSTTAGSLDGRSKAPTQPEFSGHFPGCTLAKGWLFGHSKFRREHYGHEDKVFGGESAGVRLPTGSN